MSLYTLHLTSILYNVVNEGLTKEVALISTEIRSTYYIFNQLILNTLGKICNEYKWEIKRSMLQDLKGQNI